MARKKKTRPAKAAASTPATWHEAWNRLPERTQHLICLLVLVAVALGFFAPIHFSNKRVLGGDTVQWQAMAQAMIEYEAEAGEAALWAPNVFGGMPGFMISYAPAIPQLDDVARLLRKVIWPSSHFIFLLVGVYLLIFFLTCDKLSGVFAACAYGLTTYLPILLVAGHNSKFISLCFAPWMVLGFAYALKHPRLLSGLLFAIALAANLRAGHVQITYYVSFLLGLWWLVEGVAAWRAGRLQGFGRATGYLALGAVLGVLMVAQPYLAQAEYKAYTIRGATTGGTPGGLDWTYAMAWSQGWGEMVTLLLADAYGGGGGTYWGAKTFTAGPHYVGSLVIVLALLALWRLRVRIVWAFGAAVVFMMAFALGEYLPSLNRLMFNYFPLFDAFRVPETWLSAVAFALAALAGLGLYYAGRKEENAQMWFYAEEAPPQSTKRPAQTEVRKTRDLYVALGAVAVLVVGLLLMKDVFFDFERPGEAQMLTQQVALQANVSPDDPRVDDFVRNYMADMRVERADRFSREAQRALLFLLLAGVVLFFYRREKLPAWAMQALLVVLLVIDLGGVGRRYLNEEVLVRADVPADEIDQFGFDRYIRTRAEEAGGAGHFRVLSLEADPTRNARPSFFYESLGGYHGAKLRNYQDFLDHVLFDQYWQRPNANALDLMNVRYVVAREALPGMEVVYRDEEVGLNVLLNADAVPRAHFVGQVEAVPAGADTWARLRSPDFNPRRVALVREGSTVTTTPLDSTSTASATLLRHTPREIEWRVQTDAPRLLVVSEVYYPAGWEATLEDGTVLPIHRVNDLLRGVEVPAGTHTLTMHFAPRSHTLGVLLSLIGTLIAYGGVVALLVVAWRRRSGGQAEA